MLYTKGNYKYQLYQDENFLNIGICPGIDIIAPFLVLSSEGKLTIKKGYAWDGPSGPTIDTDSFMRGSLAHDALYQLMRMGLLSRDHKDDADQLLQKICIEDKMWKIRAWWVYKGVKLGGNASTNPKNKKKVYLAP